IGEAPLALAYSFDGFDLAVGTRTSVQDYETGHLTKRFTTAAPDALNVEHGLAFSPDHKLLAASGPGDYVFARSAQDGKPQSFLPGHNNTNSALAFSPNSQLLVTTTLNGQIGAYVWATSSLTPNNTQVSRATIGQKANGYFTVAWSPDGHSFILADLSGGLV